MAHEIAAATKCRQCGETFYGPTVQIIGQPAARLQAFCAKLADHVNSKHPEHARYIQAQGFQQMGLIYLSHFTTDDKELEQWRDFLRWQVHQATLPGGISDESLKARTDELAAIVGEMASPDSYGRDQEEGIAAKLFEYFKAVRDFYEEPGKHPKSNAISPEALEKERIKS